MTEREFIEKQIEQNELKIKQLEERNEQLYQNSLLLCDEKQRFEEKIESHPKVKWQRKPNWLDGKLVGRVYWNQNIEDDDTGEVVTIERSRIVRVDGEWIY